MRRDVIGMRGVRDRHDPTLSLDQEPLQRVGGVGPVVIRFLLPERPTPPRRACPPTRRCHGGGPHAHQPSRHIFGFCLARTRNLCHMHVESFLQHAPGIRPNVNHVREVVHSLHRVKSPTAKSRNKQSTVGRMFIPEGVPPPVREMKLSRAETSYYNITQFFPTYERRFFGRPGYPLGAGQPADRTYVGRGPSRAPGERGEGKVARTNLPLAKVSSMDVTRRADRRRPRYCRCQGCFRSPPPRPPSP